MMRKQDGFSLVELMVALVVFLFAIAAATSIFIPLVDQFKRQTKIAETNIQSLVGLQLLKTDLEQAGFGLPWYFPNDTINYAETAVAPAGSTIGGVTVNDAPGNAPRAVAAFDNISSGANVNGNNKITKIVDNSDYLVIKSASVSGTDAAQKWTYVVSDPANVTNAPRVWAAAAENPSAGDSVIVIRPKQVDIRLRELVMNGTAFSTSYPLSFPSAFSPPSPPQEAYGTTFVIYDIGSVADIGSGGMRMPFNRADYFVGIPSSMPTRCAQGTGIFYKSVLSQKDGTFPAKNTMPLLDCVADMQVIFGLDLNNDGIIGTYSNANGSSVTGATTITGQDEHKSLTDVQTVLQAHLDLSDYRSELTEVRVYILAHEGQMDPRYTYPNSTIIVGDPTNLGSASLGRTFDLSAIGDPNWQHYRWKVYTIVVKLQNMR